MINNKKKLKMERLSPIPTMKRDDPLSSAPQTPEPSKVPHSRQRDSYAIETTCSPELGPLPVTSSVLTHGQSRRGMRSKVTTKSSAQLSRLISPKSNNVPSKTNVSTVSNEIPAIDDSSPLKPVYSPRHATIISASTIFPQKSLACSSSTPPLGGIINKRNSANRSLNDSISILMEAGDVSDDEDINVASLATGTGEEEVRIESFESPQKQSILPNERTTSTGLLTEFYQNPHRNRDVVKSSLVIGKVSCVEMSGAEKKNRRRALDFNTSKFTVPNPPVCESMSPDLMASHCENVESQDLESTYLRLLEDTDRSLSPVLNLTSAPHTVDGCGSNILNSSSSILLEVGHGGQSQALQLRPASCKADDGRSNVLQSTHSTLLEGHNSRMSPVFEFSSASCKTDDCRPNTLQPSPSTLLGDHNSRLSPVFEFRAAFCKADDCRSNILQPTSSTLLGDRDSRLSPVFEFRAASCKADDCRSNILQPTSSTLLGDRDSRLSPVFELRSAYSQVDDGRSDTPQPPPSALLGDHNSRLSPVLKLTSASCKADDCRSNTVQPSSSTLLRHLDSHFSPITKLKSVSCKADDLRSNVLKPTSQSRRKTIRLSPVLSLKPPYSTKNGIKAPEPISPGSFVFPSPVRNLKPSLRVDDRGSNDCEPPSHNLQRQSPILEVRPTRGVASSPSDYEFQSDSDSVIESTPRQSRKKAIDLGGFTASSSFHIDSHSPSRSGTNVDMNTGKVPIIEDFPEDKTENKNSSLSGLQFVVVSHDSSSDESALEHANCVISSIDDRHSPNLEMDLSVQPIKSFESPQKPFKPFSEAVNIDAFGSPDSNASFGHDSEALDAPSDDVIEGSTTQEFVEESEQVRPSKRRKKGSILERVKGVIAKGTASNTLFDYEIKCGLRPNKGKSVSAPLVIVNKPKKSFLVCKPLKHCKNPTHINRISSFVIVHVNKPPLPEGSVVLVHFPVSIMYYSELHIPYVMAGCQIVPHPTEPRIDTNTIDTSPLKLMDELSYVYEDPIVSYKTFSSSVVTNLTQAALCQNLVEHSDLYLTVLHLTRVCQSGVVTKIKVLCCDDESQYCWVTFSSERDIKRVAALETLKVLSDCSHIQTKGFSVVDRVRLDKKTKNLISYCFKGVSREMIFSLHPDEPDWVISSVEGEGQPCGKTPSLIKDLSSHKFGSRHLLEVHEVLEESEIILKDSSGLSIQYVKGENASVILESPFPFFLDGAYFYDGKLFSDEHTRVVRTQD